MKCQCHPGLGFAVDWGGILNNTIKAVGAVSVARSSLRLQQAQQQAALRAQEAEFQLMQRREAQMVAQPVTPIYGRPAVAPTSTLPSWAIPAAVGVAVFFLMRK